MLSTHLGRAVLVLVVPLMAAIGASSACSDNSVRYGPTSGLKGKSPNDQAISSSSGNTSSTSSSGSPEGGSGCTPPTADAGADCPTFTTMWTKYFSPTGEWGCGKIGCHVAGGQPPGPMTDQAATYTVFKTTAKVSTPADKAALPYINPGCIEDTQSSITCNIALKPKLCGLGSMPVTPPPSPASLADLAKWVSCGAPGP
jgi:hypothetical protein